MSEYEVHSVIVDTKEGKRRIRIVQDPDVESPRNEDRANLGRIVCAKSRRGDGYGDEQINRDDAERGLSLGRFRGEPIPFFEGDEELGWEKKDVVVVLPVGMIDHSGIALYIGNRSSSDPQGWDSGQIGWIYCTREKAEEEYSTKDITPEIVASIEKVLAGEVAEYSDWISGNTWGYVIEKELPACEHGHEAKWIADGTDNSCWGYIGDWDKDGALDGAYEHLGIKRHKEAVPA